MVDNRGALIYASNCEYTFSYCTRASVRSHCTVVFTTYTLRIYTLHTYSYYYVCARRRLYLPTVFTSITRNRLMRKNFKNLTYSNVYARTVYRIVTYWLYTVYWVADTGTYSVQCTVFFSQLAPYLIAGQNKFFSLPSSLLSPFLIHNCKNDRTKTRTTFASTFETTTSLSLSSSFARRRCNVD